MSRRFRYLLDPVCITACALYAVNRWLVKPYVASAFVRGHLNDLLLIPCALPPILWIQRRLGLRTHDRAPSAWEVVFHLAIWSIIAEWIGPRWLHRGVGDPWDVLAYSVGALAALCAWRSRSGNHSQPGAAP